MILYTDLSTTFFIFPSSTLRSSIKSVSLKSVKDFLIKVKPILNLSAPGAAKFVNPFALSYKELSSLTLTIVSLTFNPTLYDGVFV